MITPVSGARQGMHSPKKVEKFEESLSDASICFPTSIKKHAAPGIGRGVQNTVVRVT
jgi:hypothetical protein